MRQSIHIIPFVFLLIFFDSECLFAQAKQGKPAVQEPVGDPFQLMKYKNYREAIPGFEAELQNGKNISELQENLGLCYLKGSIDYAKAADYFRKSIEGNKNKPELLFWLANALQLNYRFDEAIEQYEKCKALMVSKKLDSETEQFNKILRGIETCNHAKELMKNPVDVSFENLGKDINSSYSERDPFITPLKTLLVFSSNRPDGNQCATPKKTGYTTDLYSSIYKNGKWTKAANLGNSINTPLNERICSMNEDASSLFLYIDNEETTKRGDVYASIAKSKVYDTPFSLSGLVNTGDEESSASVTSDGEALYFSSDREGGAGKRDLFVAKKLPDDSWGEPKRLKDNINTSLNEDFPLLVNNDRTMYFCSEGHNSMGGYDIFRSDWSDSLNNWGNPVNIGYPVNTPEDNYSISFTLRGDEGYMAAIRPEGLGDYDIYRIIFHQVSGGSYYVLKGNVLNSEVAGKPGEIKMVITNKKTKNLYGKYNISPRKKGKYCLVVTPGEYSIEISTPGAKTLTEELSFTDKNTRGEIVAKDFSLVSNSEAPKDEIKAPASSGKDQQKKK
jgi:hypothetical protein